jgi:hypothetical protein
MERCSFSQRKNWSFIPNASPDRYRTRKPQALPKRLAALTARRCLVEGAIDADLTSSQNCEPVVQVSQCSGIILRKAIGSSA